MTITAETPIRDIAVEQPNAIPLLEELGIDYCCGGKHTLREACIRRSLNVATVLNRLSLQHSPMTDADWKAACLTDLIEYILTKHHAFTRERLNLVGELTAKVERRHAHHHPEILELNKAIAALVSETSHHFYCEENILFPCIRQLETGEISAEPRVFNSLEQPITRMMMEHDQTGEDLRKLRDLTDNYQPPPDACTTFRALYRGLEELERDLHQHIHLENNILFPRALAISKEKP